MRGIRGVGFGWILLGATLAASADQVTLNDGSVLVGKIEVVANGKLTLTTDFAGKLEIDATKIKAYAVDGRVNVALASGDTLVGPVKRSGEDKSTVETAVGEIGISADQVTAIWPEGTDSPAILAAKAELEKAKPHWSATIEGGIISTEGNSDTLTGRAKAELRRKSADDLLKYYLSVDYGEIDDVRNRNEYIAGTRYENNITEKWFWYIRGELEHDEFEGLDLRATAAGGVGYTWLKKEETDLKSSVGGGYRHQAFDNGRSTDDAILDLGLEYRHDFTPYLRFTHTTVYSPSLEDFAEYRVTLDTAVAIPLGPKSDLWKLKLGFRKDYNSDPQPGFDNLDSTVYANIAVDIK